jgi:hypothetical protein
MIDEQHIDLITAYIDGSITAEQRVRFNKLIDEGEIDILDVRQMEATYHKLGQLPTSEPSEQMRKSFDAMLREKSEQQKTDPEAKLLHQIEHFFSKKRTQLFAAAAAVFVTGMLAGNLFTPFQDYRQQMQQLSNEVSEMRQVMLLSLLDAQSPTERLRAVNISSDISRADDRVISALLKTLNNDPNVNVRLASIEALLRHASNPRVREGLVKAISHQKSPQIQVALADAMITLQEPQSVNELRRLLNQDKLDSSVRNKLKNTIAALSKRS